MSSDARSAAESAAATTSADADREQFRAAILAFVTAIVLMLVVYVALFDVSSTVEKLIFGGLAIGAIGAMVAAHRFGTPARQLPHAAKIRREKRHVAMLSGTLIAVLLPLAYAAAYDLNSWSEWTVLGAIVLTTVGGGIAVQTRMR